MTDGDKKILTEKEVLGECSHEHDRTKCIKCGEGKHHLFYRFFDTPDDMVALAKRIADKRLSLAFHEFAVDYWSEKVDARSRLGWESFTLWLLTDPARFCKLVWKSGVWKEETIA